MQLVKKQLLEADLHRHSLQEAHDRAVAEGQAAVARTAAAEKELEEHR